MGTDPKAERCGARGRFDGDRTARDGRALEGLGTESERLGSIRNRVWARVRLEPNPNFDLGFEFQAKVWRNY